MLWNRFPLVRVLIPFIAGISIALYFQFTYILPLGFFFVLILLSFTFIYILLRKLSYRLRWLPGLFILLFYLGAGYQLTVLNLNANKANYFGSFVGKKNFTIATLSEPLQEKEKAYKAVVKISDVRDSLGWHSTTGKAIIYFEKDSMPLDLNYGDKILVYGKIAEISPPMNPGEFNYKAYLKNRGIEYQMYASRHDWKFLAAENGNPFYAWTYKIRDKLLKILQDAGIKGDEYAVISALLIGYTDKLDPDLIKTYQGSGVMHILSVSGMHVAIVFAMMNLLLSFFNRMKYGRIPKAVILLLFIWFYATITGLAPATIRAAAMFSFIIVAKASRRQTDIFNVLAVSLLTLLLINPFYLVDIGFQLSYLAVIGIVTIYPFIYQKYRSRYWLDDQIWSLISVSIAAQLITFPLSLYYFHQFPNYFLLTNLIAVPWSAVVIYLGMAVLMFSWFPWLAALLSKALVYALLFLNGSIATVDGLKFSVWDNISITTIEMLLLYIIIMFLMLYLSKRNKKLVLAGLAMTLLLMVSLSLHAFQAAHQQKIIIYNINKHTAMDFVDGNNCCFVSDSAMQSDLRKQGLHIYDNRCLIHTEVAKSILINTSTFLNFNNSFYIHSGLIQFMGKRLAVVSKEIIDSSAMKFDFVLLTQNANITIQHLREHYQPQQIIFDATNSTLKIKKWKQECDSLHIPYYATTDKGAWIFDINSFQ